MSRVHQTRSILVPLKVVFEKCSQAPHHFYNYFCLSVLGSDILLECNQQNLFDFVSELSFMNKQKFNY